MVAAGRGADDLLDGFEAAAFADFLGAGAEIEVEGAEGGGAFGIDAAEVGLDLVMVVFVELEDAGVEAEPEGLEIAFIATESAVGRGGLGAFVVLEGVGGEAGEMVAGAGEHRGGAIEFGDQMEFGLGEIERHNRRIRK